MKRLLAVLLAGIMMLSVAACGTKEEGTKVEVADAAELLTKVWDEYKAAASDDMMFPIGGGNSQAIVMDVPGMFDLELTDAKEELIYSYCIPESAVDMVDGVATAMNMMMSNNFTTAAYHVADKANTQAVVDAIKDATMNNQWMCGFPETLIIVTVGDEYVMSAFGNGGVIELYKEAATTAYGEAAVVVVEESLVE